MPFPSPGDLPDSGIEPRSPALQTDASPSEPSEKSLYEYICVYIYHNFFIHVLAIINSAAVSTGVHVSFWPCFSLGIWPGVGLQGHMVALFLAF